jgi:diacylglycerol kinase family enzyme
MRTYHGKLYIQPWSPLEGSGSETKAIEDIHAPHASKEEYSQWPVRIEADFKFFLATSLQWISEDFLASPNVTLSDGAMDVIWSETLTPKGALDKLLDPQKTDYIKPPLLKSQKAHSLVLEPGEFRISKKSSKDEGILNVSGEVVPYTPISIRMLPSLLTCFCGTE